MKIDLNSAFDSIKLQSMMQRLWKYRLNATTKSCRLLAEVLTHSSLCFTVLSECWTLEQQIGTQQGGTHSPAIFSRVLAEALDHMTADWELNLLEMRIAIAGCHSIWGVLFVDDGFCLFRTAGQYLRLMRLVSDMLHGIRLSVNLDKCCIVSLKTPPVRKPPAIEPHSSRCKFLGMTLEIAEGDDCAYSSLLSRATNAFMSHRRSLFFRGLTGAAS